MSCCGKKRADLKTPSEFIDRVSPSVSLPFKAEARRPALEARPKIVFEYTGNTAMAVIGAVSRLRYTFIKPGSRVEVDARDQTSLAAVPHLRHVG
jgi:hypothetical protein